MSTSHWTPARLIELSSSYWSACAIHAGLQLRLFTLLGAGRKTRASLSRESGCNDRGLAMLLDALVALRLLDKTEGAYANTPFSTEFLDATSPDYLGYILLHHHHLMEGWTHLAEAVRSGAPVRVIASRTDKDEERADFLLGMFNLASLLAPTIAQRLDLSQRRHLLDFGGGPGTYAIHFCLANPGLDAVVFDLPATSPFAQATIARYAMEERIAFASGDFLKETPAPRFDVAWLSHVLHGEGPQGARTILRHAAAALQPGGLLLVHEFILDDDRSGPPFPALFSLNMLLNTETGQAYTGAELTSMLLEVGAQRVERRHLDLPGPSGVLAAYF